MIYQDQPACFPHDVSVAVSARDDGSLLDRASGVHHPDYVARRVAFCERVGIDYADTVYQRIVYGESRTYSLIAEVDDGSTTKFTAEIVADALYTTSERVALFLPVADCVATVVYDPIRRALALAHLGRHSSYAKLASRLIRHFVQGGSDPADLLVWMSPHAQKGHYKLEWFDHADDPDWRGFYEQTPVGTYLDLAGFNSRLLERAGVLTSNIHVSSIDTMASDDYFSHLKGDTSGRIAVVAAMVQCLTER